MRCQLNDVIIASEEEMFKVFYDKIYDWLAINEYQPLVDSICENLLNSPFTLPDRKLLWDRYLTSVVPEKYLNILSSNKHLKQEIVDSLLCFSGYTIENRIKRLIDSKILRFLNPVEKQELIEKLFNFHNQLDAWTDGSWNNKINKNTKTTLNELNSSLMFNDKWVASRFLTECGYRYPHSKHSYMVWLKWSGNEKESDSYDQWYNLLDTERFGLLNPLLVDIVLNFVFSSSAQSFFPAFCQNRHSCISCPLSSNCQHYILEIDKQGDFNIDNLVLSDKVKEIPTNSLMRYLAKGCWEGSETQYQLIDEFVENFDLPKIDSGYSDQNTQSLSNFLVGIQELNKRIQHKEFTQENISFKCSKDIFDFFNYELSNEPQESFHTLILDNKHCLIQKRMITKGLLNRSLVDPREVFAPSLQLRSAAIILIHNHPSGDPKPSNQDIDITKRLTEVGKIVGIKILDHVIIGKSDYFSFADQNLLS